MARPSRPARCAPAFRPSLRRSARSRTQTSRRLTVRVLNFPKQPPVTSAELRRIARATLAAEKVGSADISVAVVDDATIRRLNRRHLNHDYATDVLSFLFESQPSTGCAAGLDHAAAHGHHIDGEVILSAEMAIRTADRLKTRAADEMAVYLVHGLLHLCGYDDQTPRRRRAMRSRERAILFSLDEPGRRPRKRGT
jgi:probable rRNA maturation factor